MDEYIVYIKNSWKKLKEKSKLEISEIEQIEDEICKMYLYCFYGYFDKLYSYNIEMLSQVINEGKNNLYFLSIYLGYIEFMEYLEKKGFDINIKDINGNNTYLVACSYNNLKIMKYLEKKGIDIYIKNKHGDNIFNIALRNNSII